MKFKKSRNIEEEFKITNRKTGVVNFVTEEDYNNYSPVLYKKQRIWQKDSMIGINNICNQRCIFCSRENAIFIPSDKNEIAYILKNQKNTISIEGGEPTLSKNLLLLIRRAKKHKIKEIILTTNGVLLADMRLCKQLVRAGVTLFNINFPTHELSLHDKIVGVKNLLPLKIKGIKNLISIDQGSKVRLTCVVHKHNYKKIPDLILFIKHHFVGIFYVEFNMIKILGKVVQRPRLLVPRLSEMKPYLECAFLLCKKYKLKVMFDGLPLCLFPAFYKQAVDYSKLPIKDYTFLSEKTKPKKCLPCCLYDVCGGIRKDYLSLYGDKELRPIIKKMN